MELWAKPPAGHTKTGAGTLWLLQEIPLLFGHDGTLGWLEEKETMGTRRALVQSTPLQGRTWEAQQSAGDNLELLQCCTQGKRITPWVRVS